MYHLHEFIHYCTLALPTEFSDSLSYYENLCRLKYIIGLIKNSEEEIGKQVDINTNDIAFLKNKINEIWNGDYSFVEHIIEDAIKNVWFGLNQEGYFVAYIPESWQSLQFATTGYDTKVPTEPEYGHLVIYEK